MACTPIRKNGVTVGFMCGSFSLDEIKLETCSECADNHSSAEFLCDYPVGNDKTCDRVLCRRCARLVGHDMHYCPTHHKEWQEFQNSGESRRQVLAAITSGKKLTVLK